MDGSQIDQIRAMEQAVDMQSHLKAKVQVWKPLP